MKTPIGWFVFLLLLPFGGVVSALEADLPESLAEALEQGEFYHAEGSYALALAQFEIAAKLLENVEPGTLAPEALWQERIHFRTEDSRWRAHRGDGESHREPVLLARARLIALVDALLAHSGSRPPQLMAEVSFSLGELDASGFAVPQWWRAWQRFNQALEWWAGSTMLEDARPEYLRLVEKIAEVSRRAGGGYGESLRHFPLTVVEDYLRLAETDAERSFAAFLFARTLDLQGHDPRQRLRIAEAYRECIAWAEQANSVWLDEALYRYAQWAERQGRLYFDENGNLLAEPDFEEAAVYYGKLLERFQLETSPHFRSARESLEKIYQSHLSVVAANTFFPGSEAFLNVRTRNVETVTVQIHAVDLTRDLVLNREQTDAGSWIDQVTSQQMVPWRSFDLTPQPAQPHGYWDHRLRIDVIPEPGAYLVTATSGDLRATDLMLVTNRTIILKTGASNALVFFADAMTGEPGEGAEVVLHEGKQLSRDDPALTWTTQRGQTDASGLVQFKFGTATRARQLIVVARDGSQQAVSVSHYGASHSGEQEHLVYAFSDRSLYRPGDTVYWKAIVRQHRNSSYSLPDGAKLDFSIIDPAGKSFAEGSAVLNDFGSAWGSLNLPAGDQTMLGVYRAAFSVEGKPVEPFQTELFRVEEIRLPEYQVTVSPRGRDRQVQSLFQLGETVSVEVSVDFLSGGPVAGAEVEIVVRESPFQQPFPPSVQELRIMPAPVFPSPGRVVLRRVHQTDGNGAVRFGLPEPTMRNRDLEYRVEARVRDVTGAEVVGSTTVRMTRQPYFVMLEPGYQLHRPGDEVSVRVQTRNANGEPVEVSGRLELVRLVWEEIWIDPRGREISGQEYHGLRQRRGIFGFGASQRNLRLLRRGYKVQDIAEVELKTDSSGEATYRRRIAAEGYYQARWISHDRTLIPIRSETSFIVADAASNDIGYHHGGLSLLVDRDRVLPGATVPILVTSPVSGRWVLLVSGDHEPDSALVVRMDGTVRLLQLTFSEERSPSTFLEATMVAENQVYQVREKVRIPPVGRRINVELQPDRDSYLPGEMSVWDIQTRDAAGRPLAAEVALAVVDDAGFLIQPDLAPPLLDFFHGRERPFLVETFSSFRWKPYLDNRPLPEPEIGLVPPPSPDPQRTVAESEVQMEALSSFAVPNDTLSRSDQMPLAESDAKTELTSLAVSLAPKPAPAIRKRFEPALFWIANLQTDQDGRGRIEVPFSDSLSRWRATARAVATDHRFGETSRTVQTKLPLVARLPLPPFLIDGDTWELGAVILNNEQETATVSADLTVQGAKIIDPQSNSTRELEVAPGRQVRIPWKMQTQGTGEVRFQFSATTDTFGDAVELTVPVQDHGIEQQLTAAGVIDGGQMIREIGLPAARREGSANVEIALTPDLAWILLEALQATLEEESNHLEAVVSKLLAALIVDGAWRGRGLQREDFLKLFSDGAETRETDWNRWVAVKIKEIRSYQQADGAFSWRRRGAQDPTMTAYAVWALSFAEMKGHVNDSAMLDAARKFLWGRLREMDFSPAEQVWALHALAMRFHDSSPELPLAVEIHSFSNLWKNRDNLGGRGLALLNTIAEKFQFAEESIILGRNLRNGLQSTTGANGSLHLFSRASGRLLQNPHTEVENTALALRALGGSEAFSRSELKAMHEWLLFARMARGWRHTRESALAILGLASYLEAEPNAKGAGLTGVFWNDTRLAEEALELHRPVVVRLGDDAVIAGTNRLRLESPEGGPGVYYRCTVGFFTGEKPIPASDGFIKISRRYEHLMPRATLLRGVKEERIAVESEHYRISRNQRLEVVLSIQMEIDAEYIVVEDRLPAGFEPTQLTSGEIIEVRQLSEDAEDRQHSFRDYTRSNFRLEATVERRGDRVRYYLDELPAGIWEVRYLLRAETPGRFHALPATVESIYSSTMSGNSAEVILRVTN